MADERGCGYGLDFAGLSEGVVMQCRQKYLKTAKLPISRKGINGYFNFGYRPYIFTFLSKGNFAGLDPVPGVNRFGTREK